MQRKPVDPLPIIRELLSRGRWMAPHEVRAELKRKGCKASHDAVTARIRDLRKDRYGKHDVKTQRRAGTTFYEYRIEIQQQINFEELNAQAA